MSVTIKDIAKKANVSITTVSRVLNKKEEGISEQTREKVLKIIEAENYQPNRIAQSMITKKTSTIGLIIPDITNPFFPEMVRGIEDYLRKKGFNLFLCNSDGDLEQELDYLKLMVEKGVDGLIYTYSYNDVDENVRKLLDTYKIPVVLLDRGQEEKNYNGVYIDNIEAGYKATKHLLNLNHKHIACITGPKNIQNSIDRRKGYEKALAEHDIPVKTNYLASGDYQMQGGYLAAKKILKNKDITAIFTLNDLMAFGVYQAVEELGLSIPGDISVVGFDNIKYNQLLSPKLTTIDQSTYDMGGEAAELLIEQINSKEKQETRNIFVSTELIFGESTKTIVS